jgi:hypothetical protein
MDTLELESLRQCCQVAKLKKIIIIITLMEAVHTSETRVNPCQTTQRNIPEGSTSIILIYSTAVTIIIFS